MTTQTDILDNSSYLPVLDHGFVGIVSIMGDDSSITQGARVSYGAGTKSVREDRGLIRYLMRHHHCYHPSMQVLTIEGWKRWDQCASTEVFLVPDPATRTYRAEQLEVLSFDVEDENLYTFKNQRMSYKVTPGHKMWFKSNYQQSYSKIPVEDMSKWGHFDPLSGYTFGTNEVKGDGDDKFRFIGFYLGDGCYASTNKVVFHLKKDRKKRYLLELLERLNVEYSTKTSWTHEDGLVIYVTTPSFLREHVVVEHRAPQKSFNSWLSSLTSSQALGLFDGLVNSDGSIDSGRNRITFSSSSRDLINLFCALSSRFGFDGHLTYETESCSIANAYPPGGRTSLESRAQYHAREMFSGKVYCTTTSTGLLAVRGDETEYGFVCGNSSPFELNAIKLHIRAPIFVLRQLFRHRTSSANEYSGRYSLMSDEFYVPSADVIQPQAKDNKQGRSGELSDKSKNGVRWLMQAAYEHAYEVYKVLLGDRAGRNPDFSDELIYDPYDTDDGLLDQDFPGVARELARSVLPVANYSELYWQQNLHNLFHLLKLRADAHAQYEIRQYAEAICKLVEPHFPVAFEAWRDYSRDAVTFSRMDIALIRDLISGNTLIQMIEDAGGTKQLADRYGMSKRELDEMIARFEIAV